MTTVTIFAAILASSAAVSLIGLWLVKRLLRHEHLEAHHPVANALLTVLGTLYSVVLGFLISAGAQYQAEVRANLEMEANSLGNIFRLAHGLPEPPRVALREACRVYCRQVLLYEWDAMEHNKTSPEAWEAYELIWDQVLVFQPADQRLSNIHEELLTQASQLGVARRTRIGQMRYHTSPLLWAVLIFGSGLVVVFSYLFATDGHLLHAVMSTFVTVSLSLIMALFYFYTHPFQGELRIQPQAFQIEKSLFQQDDSSAMPTPSP